MSVADDELDRHDQRRAARLRAALSVAVGAMSEVIEPGVFGFREPGQLTIDSGEVAAVVALCETFGFGRVMQIAEQAWNKKHPGAAHTTAAAVDVRRHVDARVRAAIAQAKAALDA